MARWSAAASVVGSCGRLQLGLAVSRLVTLNGARPPRGYVSPLRAFIQARSSVRGSRGRHRLRSTRFVAPTHPRRYLDDRRPYRECPRAVVRMRKVGVLTVEMEAAGLHAVAACRGAGVALIAVVSGLPPGLVATVDIALEPCLPGQK